MPTTFDPPIDVQISDNPGLVRFRDSAEVLNWFETERAFWRDLWTKAQGTMPDEPLQAYHNLEEQLFSERVASLSSMLTRSEPREIWIRDLPNLLTGYQSRQRVHSQSLRGRFVAEMKRPDLEARALILFSEQRPIGGTTNRIKLWLEAGFLVEAFKRGWNATGPAIEAGYGDTLVRWERVFAGAETRLKELTHDLDTREKEAKAGIDQLADVTSKHRKMLEEHTNEIQAALSKGRVPASGVGAVGK
jgi:hypothetical protein